jgi:hypothetical protein
MKHSTFAKSALALAFGLCATGALASTVTPVSEDFEGGAFASGINGVTTNNLTWADTEGGSAVEGGKLVVDAATTPTSATIDSTVTNNINAAFGRNAKFNATVTFVPATEDPTISDTNSDLKFALYAKAVDSATNLYVIAAGGTPTSTGITLDSVVDQNVEVAFTAANTFTVKVGNGDPSSEFTFKNNGDISKIEFSGNGEVGEIEFSYDANYEAAVPVPVSGGSYTISATEADYLNDLVEAKGTTAVENALKGVTGEQLKDAVLLNQDVVKDGEDAASSYTFAVTGVKKSGSDVVVDVALNRTGTVLGAINGKVTLYSATTPNGTYTKQATAKFSTTAEGDAATQTYTATFSGVSGNFFKAHIE